MRDLVKQVEQDIPIWNNKKCETRPLLVKGVAWTLGLTAVAFIGYHFFDESIGPLKALGMAVLVAGGLGWLRGKQEE